MKGVHPVQAMGAVGSPTTQGRYPLRCPPVGPRVKIGLPRTATDPKRGPDFRIGLRSGPWELGLALWICQRGHAEVSGAWVVGRWGAAVGRFAARAFELQKARQATGRRRLHKTPRRDRPEARFPAREWSYLEVSPIRFKNHRPEFRYLPFPVGVC